MSDLHVIVVNHEEQYSLLPVEQAIPGGWSVVGEPAPRQACLDEIDRLWTDMRPLSLRQRMAEHEKR